MLEPENTSITPNGDWTVDIPGCGGKIKHDHFSVFRRLVHERMIANGLDKHGWWEYAQDLMCRQRPDIPCVDVSKPRQALTIDDVVRFVSLLDRAVQDGAQPVDDTEYERRLSICKACPKRQYVESHGGGPVCGGFCGWFSRALSNLVMGVRSNTLNELFKKSCPVCGCEITSMARYPLDLLHEVDSKTGFLTDGYPENCWKAHPKSDEMPPESPSAQPASDDT